MSPTLAALFCNGCAGTFLFWIAIASGCFFGVYGFLMTWLGQRAPENCPQRLFGWTQLLFQFWFNAAGGLFGWAAVWLLWQSPFGEYGWRHLVAFLVAFSGVTGNLPYFSYAVKDGFALVMKRWLSS